MELTDEEWDDYFGESVAVEPRGRRPWVRILGFVLVGLMMATGAPAAFNLWRDRNIIRSPESVELAALERVEESPWGWLVTNVVVQPNRAEIGAFVRNNPPDGVIHITTNAWQPDDLRETVDHEIGHLLDFAIYSNVAPDPGEITDTGEPVQARRERRGGLESEVWAECYAVSTGERGLDPSDADQQYRCTPEEFEIHLTEMEAVTEVCRPWGQTRPVCRRSR